MKQYDKDHKIQRLYIHWDVSTQCQLKCSYCYAKKHYGDDWGKIDKWSSQKIVLHTLDRASLPIYLGLLGGEPTDHPHYEELIDRCYDVITNHPDGRMYITTNGLQPTSFFENHKVEREMRFLFSYHPEYEMKYGKGHALLLDNIKAAMHNGMRVKVNVLLHSNRKLWSKTHVFVDELEKLDGIEIHPHFVYEGGNVHKLTEYTQEFYEEFKRFADYPEYLVFGNNIYNDYNLFANDIAHFEGWKCWNNNYEISWDGVVNQFCFNDYQPLISNMNYFANIEEIKPKICPHTGCNCDGLLKIYKESPDE